MCKVPGVHNSRSLLLSTALAALFASACGSNGSSGSGFDAPDAAEARDGGSPSADDSGSGTTSDASFGATPDAGTSGPSEVYGHSADTLYKLDPDTKAVTVVGAFDGCTSVIDIALDKDSHLFGTTSSALWSIDRTTAKCSRIATGSYPNSLSFVPAGTLDPNAEALVGYEGGSYVRIDPQTGAKSKVGTLGGGLSSSGDIVSVKGGGTYLTVKGANCNDCLVEVSPATGALVKNWGPVAHTDVFGLAFWAGKVYGFDNGGELFEVTLSGSTLSTAPIAIPSAPAGLQFWGAGSTTSAPVNPK